MIHSICDLCLIHLYLLHFVKQKSDFVYQKYCVNIHLNPQINSIFSEQKAHHRIHYGTYGLLYGDESGCKTIFQGAYGSVWLLSTLSKTTDGHYLSLENDSKIDNLCPEYILVFNPFGGVCLVESRRGGGKSCIFQLHLIKPRLQYFWCCWSMSNFLGGRELHSMIFTIFGSTSLSIIKSPRLTDQYHQNNHFWTN